MIRSTTPSSHSRPGKERRAIAEEAGFRRLSVLSIVAGTLAGYGAFALVAAITGAILSALDVDTEFRTNDWAGSGAVGGLITALVLLVAYLFGGYVAGRMARRSGFLHGLAVFVLSLLGGGIVGVVVGWLSESNDVESNLQSIGIPTSGDEITGVAVAAGIASIVAILVGSVLGAKLGERWHSKLAHRAADPGYGPAAESRRRAEHEDEQRHRRLEDDPVVERQTSGNDDERLADGRDEQHQPHRSGGGASAIRS